MTQPSIDVKAEREIQEKRSREACEDYLGRTPELRQVIEDFTTSCLAVKPQDVRAYAVHYFGKLSKDTVPLTNPASASLQTTGHS